MWARVSTRVLFAAPFLAFESLAQAADFEGTLKNLVNAFVARILPILALAFLGKNIFAHVQGDPNARQESFRVVTAIACLIGINAVWTYIGQQVR